jgi:hypothetical protein
VNSLLHLKNVVYAIQHLQIFISWEVWDCFILSSYLSLCRILGLLFMQIKSGWASACEAYVQTEILMVGWESESSGTAPA